MTLITYMSRVHFADGVLEEALRSELEAQGLHRPLLLCSEAVEGTEFADRLISGVPFRAPLVTYSISPRATKYDVATDVVSLYDAHNADVLIAFGSVTAIAFGRKCRHSIGVSRAAGEPGPEALPPYFVVPGIDGFPDPCRVSYGPGAPPSRGVPPSAVICDPTLTLGAGPADTASAGVSAMGRCIEAYLSPVYNPPADGIALDGVERAVENLHRAMSVDQIDVRREMMAVALNGSLAQQKGVGPTQALVEALAQVRPDVTDAGAIKRLLLPGVIEALAGASQDRLNRLHEILNLRVRDGFGAGLAAFFRDLPLPNSLEALGLTEQDLEAAADLAHQSVDIALPEPSAILSLLQSVHGAQDAVPHEVTLH